MGGVFAWSRYRPPRAGSASVTGLVGAAGGLGGFFPPLVMGATQDKVFDGYGLGLGLLCLVALAGPAFTHALVVARPPKEART